VFGIHEGDPRLIVLGATGVVASLLVLARVSWPRARRAKSWPAIFRRSSATGTGHPAADVP
jgi:hypothetical protein